MWTSVRTQADSGQGLASARIITTPARLGRPPGGAIVGPPGRVPSNRVRVPIGAHTPLLDKNIGQGPIMGTLYPSRFHRREFLWYSLVHIVTQTTT